MTEPAHPYRPTPPPQCPCGRASLWLGRFGRACEVCLPAEAAFWVARGWLSRAIDAAFDSVVMG